MLSEEIYTLLKTYHTRDLTDLQLRKCLEILQKENISVIHQQHPLYPSAFFNLRQPPSLLYVKGKLPQDFSHALTIVGTRTATRYGTELSYTIANSLAKARMPIISGLARGIDSAAHEGAVEGGITVAIIGSGHAHLYPKENIVLSEKICEQGAVISEYPPLFSPKRYSFVQRNRLLAALGAGSLLIESNLTGGSMITMNEAEKLGRPLFALPGAVDLPSFKGNFALIKQRKAFLVEGAEDILDYFKLSPSPKKSLISYDLSTEEQKVYDSLSGHEKSLEELVLLTQLPIMKLNILLTSLTIKGAVKEFAGKLYKKNNNTSY
jgi:DNA processing protein